ncbi:MAG: LacI family transcriptional regulator [Defluviitaleaceae bacterium]|nr:LacI family transcriptional regulator [Defluviitaleaceae bacterium]
MQKLTIYDISNLSGVSVTTVSRVINGSSNVNKETRKRVEKVIEEHGYVPKQSVRNFTQTGFVVVGLMMDDIRHSYMSELAYSIDQELRKWKVNVIVCNIVDVEREFIGQVDDLIDKCVKGIILLGSVFENNICKVAIERRYRGFPFVTVNANFSLPNVYEVLQDQAQGARDAVRYLYGQGRRNIGFVFRNKSQSDRKKLLGFKEGMMQCNLNMKRMFEVEELTLDGGKAATASMIGRHPDTDAVIYSGDLLAVGGTHYLNETQIQIPEQVAVIGFNNSSCAGYCYPPLTSIDNRISESGKAAAKILLNVLNQQAAENVMIKCGMVVRSSTEVYSYRCTD